MQHVVSDFQDQLVRGLSHRMNNILSLFHGYLGLLMDDVKLDAVAKEGLKKIREGARAATDLMERTNAVSRPPGSMEREVSVADFFRQLAPAFAGLHGPEIRLSVICPDELPRVTVDPSRLRLVLTELIRNACEAAHSKVAVRVTTNAKNLRAALASRTAPETAEQWLKIEITDDGAGIRASDAKRIYEPFFSTKKKPQCAGLGLAVALGCAQQFGGSLAHRSRKGETTFEMILPIRAPHQLGAVA